MSKQLNLEMIPLPPKTPSCDKEASCRGDAGIIGEFLEWLGETHPNWDVSDIYIVRTMEEYFGIDAEACELERRKLLAYQRILNTRGDAFKELGLE